MTEFGREYGDGLYALCVEERITDEVLGQLAGLKKLFRENPDFVRLLSNMSLPKSERTQIADNTLKNQVHPYVLNFIKLLVERGAVFEFGDCESAFRDSYQADHRISEAHVTTARPLNDEQRRKLIGKLRRMTGREIQLRETTDPSVLGGVLLEMDGRRYDNTIRHRLGDIRQVIREDEPLSHTD